jgi:hypothetical protein
VTPGAISFLFEKYHHNDRKCYWSNSSHTIKICNLELNNVLVRCDGFHGKKYGWVGGSKTTSDVVAGMKGMAHHGENTSYHEDVEKKKINTHVHPRHERAEGDSRFSNSTTKGWSRIVFLVSVCAVATDGLH